MHNSIETLAEQARTLGDEALRLRRTSRSRPYKVIEFTWETLRNSSESALETLSLLHQEIDTMPDGGAKQAALELANVYHDVLGKFIDYGHSAVTYERAENSSSVIFAKQEIYLNFSVPRSKGRSAVDNYFRHFLDWRSTEISDSLRSLKIPEYRYGSFCEAGFAPVPMRIGEPCALNGRLDRLHATIMKLDGEAFDAGYTAEHLHHTSRWPSYRRVEYDWREILARSQSSLDALSELALSLETLPHTERKDRAIELLSAYRSGFENLVNYAHWAVYVERHENLTSWNTRSFLLSFGVIRDSTKGGGMPFVRWYLDGRTTKVQEVVLALKLPEYRYEKACRRSLPRPVLASVREPCNLAPGFLTLHASLQRLGAAADDLGNTARSIHHTSHWIPYRRVERGWSDMKVRAGPLLSRLTDFSVALDDAPKNAKKQAAYDLLSVYQDALEHVIDYAHFAVFFERVENAGSASFNLRELTWGLQRIPMGVNQSNLSRELLESNVSEAYDALLSLRLPEHHYAGLCKITFPNSPAAVAVRP